MDDEERFIVDAEQEEFTMFLLSVAIFLEVIAGFALVVLILFGSVILGIEPAHAQMAPMPLYQHPAPGTYDPYADHSLVPSNCCSGRDCMPWPGEDIEPLPDGRYLIKSANGGKGAPVELHKIHPSFNGQYHVCKPDNTQDKKFIDTLYNGTAMVYCLFVPMGM